MKRLTFLLCIVFILLLSVSIAEPELNSFTSYYQILDDRVKTTYRYELGRSDDSNLYIVLPKHYNSLILLVDGAAEKPFVESGKLRVPLTPLTQEVKIVYFQDGVIDLFSKDQFISDLQIPFDTKEVIILTALPKGAYLSENPQSQHIALPRPTAIVTDGQRIIIKWKFLNVNKGEVISNFIMFDYTPTTDYWILGTILLMSLVIILNLIYGRKRRTKVDQKDIEEHLKDDEKIIINVLKNKGGQSTQATLRVVTGMSKSTLSRLVMELEHRKIVHKEKKGNKNLVTLK